MLWHRVITTLATSQPPTATRLCPRLSTPSVTFCSRSTWSLLARIGRVYTRWRTRHTSLRIRRGATCSSSPLSLRPATRLSSGQRSSPHRSSTRTTRLSSWFTRGSTPMAHAEQRRVTHFVPATGLRLYGRSWFTPQRIYVWYCAATQATTPTSRWVT